MIRSRSRRVVTRGAAGIVALGLLFTGATLAPSLASADDDDNDSSGRRSRAPFVCAQDKTRFYAVDEKTLPFDAIPGTDTERSWGVLDHAGYRIEVPKNWNGELVMWAHGFAGWGCQLGVDNPMMRKYLVENGYAWAASSYAANGYAVQQGVDDTMALLKHFRKTVDKPKRAYMSGASMGGHITGVAIEQHHSKFDGAMPVCGVMGSGALFDYFVDVVETAQAISGVQSPYPYGVDWFPVWVDQIKAELGGPASPKFQTWAASVMQRSGGTRPGFAVALFVWADFLYGLAQPNPGVVPAFPATNVGTVYQLDNDPALNAAEAALNASVRRVTRFDFPTPDGQVDVPEIRGDVRVPTVTLHTIGDLFVPFSMQQIYLRRAISRGDDANLVQRAIRDVGHCTFAEAELNRGFADMVSWVKTGVRPAGDAIDDPAAVANPRFGCTFSDNTGIFTGTDARPAFPC